MEGTERTTGETVVGIDVGGTSIRFALVAEGRVVDEVLRRATECWHSPNDFLRLMATEMACLLGQAQLQPGKRQLGGQLVGLAMPGLVDQERGCLMRSVNLPFLEGFPIRSELARHTGCAVQLMTDSVAATWGEYQSLSEPPSVFAHLRVGTGIALGIVRDGTLVDLDTGRSRHMEVLVVEQGAQALACRCGLRGCLETVASGRALAEKWSSCGAGGLDELRTAYLQDESEARGIIDRMRKGLRCALHNIAQRFGVKHCVLGGGVVQRFPELADMVIADAQIGDSIHVERAALGDNAGVIGAALLAARN